MQPMTPPQPLMQVSMKPPSPLQPKYAPKSTDSHPQRRHRFQTTTPPDLQGMAAVPAGPGRGAGGRRRGLAGLLQATQHHWCGGRRRDRRAQEGQAAAARPGRASSRRTEQHQQPSAAGVEGAGGTGGHGRASRRGAERSEALASRAAGPSGARNASGATSSTARTRAEGNPYSPRNALIAGISRTACTRPAR